MRALSGKKFFTALRAVAFVALFFVLLNMVSVAFVPKYDNDETGMVGYITKSYNGEAKNTIDVFFVGNSDVYRAVSPMRIWNETGVTSCVSGKGNQTPSGAYKLVTDMYKTQSPKVVFIETDMLYRLASGESGAQSLKASLKLALDFVKTRFTNLDAAAVSGIGYYFPVLKYHDRWHKLNKEDFTNTKASYCFDNKGFISDFSVKGYNLGFSYMGTENDAPEKLNMSSSHYLKKIINYCEKRGSKVVLLEVPSASSWSYKRHNAVSEAAQKLGVDFIDMNIENTVSGFNWATDTKDGGDHLNTHGAEKVSMYLADYLSNNFALSNKKADMTYNGWNELSKAYEADLINKAVSSNDASV